MKYNLIFLILCCASVCFAQKKSWFSRMDSLRQDRYCNTNVDSAYLTRPEEPWLVRLRGNLSGHKFHTKGTFQGGTMETTLDAPHKFTVSGGASYRGISVDLSLNPAHLTKKSSDLELNINAYGNRMGVDVTYHKTRNMTGKVTEPELGWNVDWPEGLLNFETFYLTGYYAFNHRRFSMPAAFSQSYIQKKSAGSLLAGASFSYVSASVLSKLPEGFERSYAAGTNITFRHFSLGGGYGYNFVLPHQWLIHISAVPTFTFYTHDTLHQPGDHGDVDYQFPELYVPVRTAIQKTFGNYIVGASGIYAYSRLGNIGEIRCETFKWRVRTFIGVRF